VDQDVASWKLHGCIVRVGDAHDPRPTRLYVPVWSTQHNVFPEKRAYVFISTRAVKNGALRAARQASLKDERSRLVGWDQRKVQITETLLNKNENLTTCRNISVATLTSEQQNGESVGPSSQ
jgi:hypothetical protein